MKESQQSVPALNSRAEDPRSAVRRIGTVSPGPEQQGRGSTILHTADRDSQQFGAPTQEKSHTHSVGEEGQFRTRSVGTVVGQDGQDNKDQTSGQSAAGRKSSSKKSSSTFLKGLISGTVISDSLILKDIRYSVLILLLGIIFIANRFNAERVEREAAVLEQEVRDMRAEALSVSADLGSVSRQSEITDLVKERGLGLEELRDPPYRIVVNE